MSSKIVIILAGLVSCLAVTEVIAGDLEDVKVTFRTMACDGATGFASVNADDVYNIAEIKCGPNSKVKKVHQVMIKKGSTGTSYGVFTVSEKEAETLMQKIEAFQDDKRKSLRDSNRYIFKKE